LPFGVEAAEVRVCRQAQSHRAELARHDGRGKGAGFQNAAGQWSLSACP
jgi:hypothetical protein